MKEKKEKKEKTKIISPPHTQSAQVEDRPTKVFSHTPRLLKESYRTTGASFRKSGVYINPFPAALKETSLKSKVNTTPYYSRLRARKQSKPLSYYSGDLQLYLHNTLMIRGALMLSWQRYVHLDKARRPQELILI